MYIYKPSTINPLTSNLKPLTFNLSSLDHNRIKRYASSEMFLYVFVRPNSEFERPVENFMHDFERQYHVDAKIKVMNLDTRDGAAMASLYDVVRYPAFVATREDGTVQDMWQGQELPMMSEVAGALHA